MLKGRDGRPYVIAEVGQNHNGSLGMAAELVRLAADPRPQEQADADALPELRADAVKFTKRKLAQELSGPMAATEYTGPHSFGTTYGVHRENLELRWPAYTSLSDTARLMGVQFGVTICHPDLVSGALEHVTALAFLKVASRDIGNVPLLERIAELAPGVPKVVSLGMATEDDLARVLRIFADQLDTLTVMHCRSVYPAPPHVWDLQLIPELKYRLGPEGVQVGYSDHSLGLAACIAATAMGADVLEKHVTLDRRMRGSDHQGSVDRGGLYRLLRDVTAVALGASGDLGVSMRAEAKATRAKLGRSLAWAVTLMPGTEVTEKHLCLVSPGTGLPWDARDALLGRKVTKQVEQLALCAPEDVA